MPAMGVHICAGTLLVGDAGKPTIFVGPLFQPHAARQVHAGIGVRQPCLCLGLLLLGLLGPAWACLGGILWLGVRSFGAGLR